MLIHLLRTAVLILSLASGATALAQTTVTLQDGLNGYAGTTDTKILSTLPTTNYGSMTYYELTTEPGYSATLLIRFAIFAAEGGPVPNNATINSATLSFYKYWGPSAVFQAARLSRSWQEMQATWNVAASGTSWQTAGALGANDVSSTADGQASVGDASVDGCSTPGPWPAVCWLNINVTPGVQAFATNPATNFGWKLSYVSGANDHMLKEFNSRENIQWPTLRPKLTITYTTPSTCNSGVLRPYEGAPINGTPIQIGSSGATFEAEHFNCGGEGVAYHDLTVPPGPVAGQTFRTGEGVQIKNSPPGGLAVAEFNTGEWMVYTINVTTAGDYDFSISTASNWTVDGSYRLYIDDVAVPGDVVVPRTGSWETYAWVTNQRITLTAGQHNLKLYSAGEFYRVDKLRLTTPPGVIPPTARLTATPGAGAPPLNVSFSASGSTQGTYPITALRLQFGDGSADATWTDKTIPQSHTYGANGSYTATLTVTASNGGTATDTQPIVVGSDECAVSGLSLCVRFEAAPDTQFDCVDFPCTPDRNQVRSQSLGTTFTWYAHNLGGDSATDTRRIAQVDGGRDGSKAIKLTTQPGDCGWHSTCSSSPWERSELSTNPDYIGATQGVEQWWAHSMYLPPEFQIAAGQYKASTFLQFNPYPDANQPNVALELFNEPGTGRMVIRARTNGAGGLDTDGRQYTYSTGGSTGISGVCINDNPQRGVWYDFVHRIIWSGTNTGRHEIWMRAAGSPVQKVLDRSNINTLYGSGYRTYLKIGTYHDPVPAATSVIHDRIRRGNSFQSVAMPDFPMQGAVPASGTACSGATSP